MYISSYAHGIICRRSVSKIFLKIFVFPLVRELKNSTKSKLEEVNKMKRKTENRTTKLSRLVNLGDEYEATTRLYRELANTGIARTSIPMVRLEVEGPYEYWTLRGMPSSVTVIQGIAGKSEGLRQRDASVAWFIEGKTVEKLVADGLLKYEPVDVGELPSKAWPTDRMLT